VKAYLSETDDPPPGGYGAGPPSKRFGPEPEVESPGRSAAPIITAALVVATLASVLVLVVLGCRRYIAVAKTAEVRVALADIAKHAAAAHEPTHRVCPSASLPVPATDAAISGRKYQSTSSEWVVDAKTNAGFACLGYELPGIQYFQYRYDATPSSFTARGRGDLDGNGVFSDFTWSGHVVGDRLVIADAITETNTEE
jgi:hypothetical protein